MKIKLKTLVIENFKGIKALSVDFADNTEIKGINASGKTTIFDGFTWLLFNKNSAGEEKFNVRPLDVNGNTVDNVEIKVVATLDVDGKEVELSKVQKQNWVKHRGAEKAVLEGNPNSYEIDGYPKSEKDFKSYISELVAEDLFKMITNPQYFTSMKWQDQRKTLMQLVSEVSDLEIAQGNEKYALLIPEIEKASCLDDIKAKFQKAFTEWNKKLKEIPARIDEVSKMKCDINVAEQELAKADLEKRIAEVDDKISNSGTAVDSLCSESIELQFAINGMYTEQNDKLIHQKREFENQKSKAQSDFNDAHLVVHSAECQIKNNEELIKQEDEKRLALGDRYKEVFASSFDDSKWVFDENSTVCSLCGQTYPSDKIESIKADFELKKANAKEKFESDKSSKLDDIEKQGLEYKNHIESLKRENEELQKKIEENKAIETTAMAEKNRVSKLMEELPEKPDMSGNEEYLQKQARYEVVQKQIADLKSSNNAADEFKEERKNLVAELDSVKDIISKASKNVEIDSRIEELENEQKEVAQKVADQEQMIYLLEEFIREKMMIISDSVNKHFKTVNFKLFTIQLNGGLKETCECTVNGIPYSTLNSGHRIVAGLDIISSLSELYGVEAPIFIDNAESINEFNLPKMDAQMILLSVSDDKELVVQ
ncbi:MAG: AAA family ATPase [Prevotella sp.]